MSTIETRNTYFQKLFKRKNRKCFMLHDACGNAYCFIMYALRGLSFECRNDIVLTPFCNETEWEEKVKKLSRAEALKDGEVELETTATSVAAKTLCIPLKQVMTYVILALALLLERYS